MPKRYYLHGDEHEHEAGRFYCARCDLFARVEHFEDPRHQENAEAKFQATKATFKTLSKRNPTGYVRPKDGSNLLIPFPEKKKQFKSRFFRWLQRQASRDDPIGDLANDTSRDSVFPVGSESHEKIREHLQLHGACDEALVALDEAFQEFRAAKPIRTSLSPKLRFEVFRRDNYSCQICGATAHDNVQLEVDHIHPVSKGGTDGMENLQTLCKPCNRGKGANDL